MIFNRLTASGSPDPVGGLIHGLESSGTLLRGDQILKG